MRPQNDIAAFSLVELSIVLVILGLLTGGILGGKELIRAAELRSVMTESQQLQTVVNAFKGKYNALPGDMKNAERFWGTKCSASQTGSPGACNGDGNGQIAGWVYTSNCSGGNYGSNGQHTEVSQFWKQLANAGLHNNSLPGYIEYVPEITHLQPAKIGGDLYWVPQYVSHCNHRYWRETQGNVLVLGTPGSANGTRPEPSASLSPEEAWSIDSKYDDGVPSNGGIRVKFGETNTSHCTTQQYQPQVNGPDVEYKFVQTTSVTPKCALYFTHAF